MELKAKLNLILFAVSLIMGSILFIQDSSAVNINACQILNTANTYYRLTMNVDSAGTCFTINGNNITIDGQGFTVNYSKSLEGDGVDNLGGFDNITIKNVNFIQENSDLLNADAIHFIGSVYGNITNNTITTSAGNPLGGGAADGVNFNSSSFSSISNNKITLKGHNSDGVYLFRNSNSNSISNNIFTVSGTLPPAALAGVNIGIASGNNITGGSVISRNTYDYILFTAGTTNYFRNTNFTAMRKIYFYDSTSWFNYNNETSGNIWLKTRVSAAPSSINRTLVTWSQPTMKWNDTSNIAGTTATYNLTGLLPNRQYMVKNTTNSGSTTQIFMTNGNGDLPGFMIRLSGNTEVLVKSVTISIAFVPPTDNNGATISRNWTYVNTTVSDDVSPNNITAFINWNNSLVGWWRFNNEAGESSTLFKDWSGWGNDGTCPVSNCPVLTLGKFRNATMFDGSNDYIRINSVVTELNSVFTVTAWIKTSTSMSPGSIVTFHDSGGDNKWRLEVNGNNAGIAPNDATGSRIVTDNRWHHITGVTNGVISYIYVDGVLDLGSVATNTNLVDTDLASIGQEWDPGPTASDFFDGAIDEVQIWNRILSPEEIRASYNAGVYRLYHNFTELADGTYSYTAYAQDLSGNVNQTETRTITIGPITMQPSIRFINPTPNNGATINKNHVYINASVSGGSSPNNLTAFIDWDNSLTGWWRFNGETGESSTLFNDWSGWGNDGTCSAPNCPVSATGKFGNALQFDGSNDYVNAGIAPSLDIGTGDFTWSLWAYVQADQSNNHLMSKWRWIDPVNQGVAIIVHTGPWIQASLGDSISSSAIGGIPATSIPVQQWKFIVVTREFGAASIYIDGVLKASGNRNYNVNTNTPLAIGGSFDTGHPFNGRVDDVRVYNRALSPEEIKASYNSGVYRLYRNFTELADGTYSYTAYAQDLAGNVNQTETRTVTIATGPITPPPSISFVYPTPNNGASTNKNHMYVNASVSGGSSPNNLTAFIDFNNSLVGWWRFNNEAGESSTLFKDWSSWGNDGTCSAPNCPVSATGKFGNALQFDGSNDYVSVSNFNQPASATITGWIKVSSFPSANSAKIVGSNNAYIELYSSGALAFWVNNGTNIANVVYTITPNNWYYVTGIFANGNQQLYVNGILQAQSTRTGNIPAITGLTLSNSYPPSAGYNGAFNGAIDEVRIFNRALSPEEISASYNAGVYRTYHNFTNLQSGTYTYTAYVQDLAGNVGQTEARTLTIDTESLSVTVTDAPDPVESSKNITFTVVCTDPAAQMACVSGTKTYTSSADFNEGTFSGVAYNAGSGRIELVIGPVITHHLMWIANAGEDTVSKWDTNANKELARYHTWFGTSNHDATAGAAPSRTAVDINGNAYVANRHFDNKPAEVFKILADDYIDRNGNGMMDTSSDLNGDGTISAGEMPLMADLNGNGRIDANEIVDERIAWVTTVGPNNCVGRSLAIDLNNYIWLGCYSSKQYYKLNSSDGSIIGAPINVAPHTPYGALVDKYGILWSASSDPTLLKMDTNNPASRQIFTGGVNYGIALGYDASSRTQVYLGSSGGYSYLQFNSATNTFTTPAAIRYQSNGLATDLNGYILPGSIVGGVTKFSPSGSVIWTAPAQVSSSAHGTVIDSDNNVWLIHIYANKLSKFRGSDGAPLGVFNSGHRPYTYSDATGSSLRTSISAGTWDTVYDSNSARTKYGSISWTETKPPGTSITLKVRNSNDGVSWSPWEDISSGAPPAFTRSGQYIEIKATFTSTNGAIPTLDNLQLPVICAKCKNVTITTSFGSCTTPAAGTCDLTTLACDYNTYGYNATATDYVGGIYGFNNLGDFRVKKANGCYCGSPVECESGLCIGTCTSAMPPIITIPDSGEIKVPLGGVGRMIVKIKNPLESNDKIELQITGNPVKLHNWIWFDGHRYDENKNKIALELGPGEERAVSINIYGGEVMNAGCSGGGGCIQLVAKSIHTGLESALSPPQEVSIAYSDDGMTVKTPEFGWLGFMMLAVIGALLI